jgi:Holliday junction resolvasome RuvABC endonuclease subunit
MTAVLEEYLHRQTKEKPPPQVPLIYRPTPVIASFDQTLRAMGVVLASVGEEGKILVWHHETIKTPDPGIRSYEETYARTDALLAMTEEFLGIHHGIGHVVIEQPPMGGGFRTESSTFAAYAVSRACRKTGHSYSYMQSRRARVLVVGKGSADSKSAMHHKLAELVPETKSRKWNEHTRDALGNLIAYVIESQEGS